MALLALTYGHDAQFEGTRDGIPIYDGSASMFHDWLFHTQVQYKAAKEEDRVRVMSQIVGLRGDAADIVRDIGAEAILKEDGLTVLTESLRKTRFPQERSRSQTVV